MESIDRLSLQAIADFKHAVREAEGQEVCSVGKLSEDRIVSAITVVARGNETAVPALMPHLEKGDVVIHNHPSGNLRPSEPDIRVASHLGNLGIGFFIVDNEVDRVYVVAEPFVIKRITPLEVDELTNLLGPGGSLERLVGDYEERPGQIEMLERVASAFNGDSICVAEAGTGIGKSLAYLIPALSWAERNDERVVVSTATINLQQQLIDKDIPLVSKLLGSTVKVALVKGRNNYLCLRKLNDAVDEDSLFDEDDSELRAIAEWSGTSRSGARSDLSFVPADGVWSRVGSEADSCVGLRCRFRERCFVLAARREAASAQLLVVNHHLLFSDLSMRLSGAGFENTAVLPPFQRVIFDEAHNIENSATSYFSEAMNKLGLARQLGRLLRHRKGRALGLALSLQRLSGKETLTSEVEARIREVEARADLLDSAALGLFGKETAIRLITPVADETKARILEPIGELEQVIVSLVNLIRETMETLDDESLESPDAYEIRIIEGRLSGYAGLCESFRRYDEIGDRVFWASAQRTHSGDPFVEFIMTPLDVSPLMREAVFEPYRTVVCTSATLTVRRDFSFWLSRVGLLGFERRPIETVYFPSPFPYEERVLLGVPNDAPEPTSDGYEVFAGELIGRVLEVSEGSGLVLFTSYAMLKRVFQAVEGRLAQRGIAVLKQGEDDRARLLERFKNDVSSVLFATDSFWEGVDAPGETLRVVIICRLPFKVPSDPVIQARMEAIDQRNGSSFLEYALPLAVMRLKQGFGRLMRRQTDRGVVLVLDPRIVRKSYGSMFFDSLPPTRKSVKAADQLLADVERFLYEK